LVELREENGWRPRRVVGGPKTIEEVHWDAYLLSWGRRDKSMPSHHHHPLKVKGVKVQ
jgi:hypothetical protein